MLCKRHITVMENFMHMTKNPKKERRHLPTDKI